MKINQVEELVGITKKNIRFYEEQGLICPERDSRNGYREYNLDDVKCLNQIKLLRRLEVPIEEIRKIQTKEISLEDCLDRHISHFTHKQSQLDIMKEMCKKMTDTIQEKDSEILSLKSEKDNLEGKIEEEKKEFEKRLEEAGQKQANLVGKTIVDNEFLNEKERLLEEKDRIIREKDNKLKENQQITIELVKDMHELEDKFIENGGDLSELYSDYNEYYQWG